MHSRSLVEVFEAWTNFSRNSRHYHRMLVDCGQSRFKWEADDAHHSSLGPETLHFDDSTHPMEP